MAMELKSQTSKEPVTEAIYFESGTTNVSINFFFLRPGSDTADRLVSSMSSVVPTQVQNLFCFVP